MRLKLLAFAAAFALVATAAEAGTVLSDNFDNENGGASSLQYTGFANFNVTGTGVDIVRSGDFGITCAGGSGSCVDLDGSPGPGGLITKNSYAFTAGDLVKLSFQIAGNQRQPNSNTFFAGFDSTTGNISAANYTTGGGYGDSVVFSGPFVFSLVDTSSATSSGSQAFETYTLSFQALGAGSVQAFVATEDPGVAGPLLDNVSLSIGAVPEPASWAMMLLGVGMIGAGVRIARRKSDLSPTAA